MRSNVKVQFQINAEDVYLKYDLLDLAFTVQGPVFNCENTVIYLNMQEKAVVINVPAWQIFGDFCALVLISKDKNVRLLVQK